MRGTSHGPVSAARRSDCRRSDGLRILPLRRRKASARADLASQAVRLEQALTTEGARLIAGKPAQQLRREGDIALARGNPRQALNLFAAAVAAEPCNSANWFGYARAALAIDPGNDWDERYKLQDRQATAAYAAYQRAATPADEATALALLGEVYAAQQDLAPVSQRLCGEPQGSGRSRRARDL